MDPQLISGSVVIYFFCTFAANYEKNYRNDA